MVNRIAEACRLLNSSRQAERKKGYKELGDALKSEADRCTLFENSLELLSESRVRNTPRVSWITVVDATIRYDADAHNKILSAKDALGARKTAAEAGKLLMDALDRLMKADPVGVRLLCARFGRSDSRSLLVDVLVHISEMLRTPTLHQSCVGSYCDIIKLFMTNRVCASQNLLTDAEPTRAGKTKPAPLTVTSLTLDLTLSLQKRFCHIQKSEMSSVSSMPDDGVFVLPRIASALLALVLSDSVNLEPLTVDLLDFVCGALETRSSTQCRGALETPSLTQCRGYLVQVAAHLVRTAGLAHVSSLVSFVRDILPHLLHILSQRKPAGHTEAVQLLRALMALDWPHDNAPLFSVPQLVSLRDVLFKYIAGAKAQNLPGDANYANDNLKATVFQYPRFVFADLTAHVIQRLAVHEQQQCLPQRDADMDMGGTDETGDLGGSASQRARTASPASTWSSLLGGINSENDAPLVLWLQTAIAYLDHRVVRVSSFAHTIAHLHLKLLEELKARLERTLNADVSAWLLRALTAFASSGAASGVANSPHASAFALLWRQVWRAVVSRLRITPANSQSVPFSCDLLRRLLDERRVDRDAAADWLRRPDDFVNLVHVFSNGRGGRVAPVLLLLRSLLQHQLIGTPNDLVSGAGGDHHHSWRRDLLEKLLESDATLYLDNRLSYAFEPTSSWLCAETLMALAYRGATIATVPMLRIPDTQPEPLQRDWRPSERQIEHDLRELSARARLVVFDEPVDCVRRVPDARAAFGSSSVAAPSSQSTDHSSFATPFVHEFIVTSSEGVTRCAVVTPLDQRLFSRLSTLSEMLRRQLESENDIDGGPANDLPSLDLVRQAVFLVAVTFKTLFLHSRLRVRQSHATLRRSAFLNAAQLLRTLARHLSTGNEANPAYRVLVECLTDVALLQHEPHSLASWHSLMYARLRFDANEVYQEFLREVARCGYETDDDDDEEEEEEGEEGTRADATPKLTVLSMFVKILKRFRAVARSEWTHLTARGDSLKLQVSFWFGGSAEQVSGRDSPVRYLASDSFEEDAYVGDSSMGAGGSGGGGGGGGGGNHTSDSMGVAAGNGTARVGRGVRGGGGDGVHNESGVDGRDFDDAQLAQVMPLSTPVTIFLRKLRLLHAWYGVTDEVGDTKKLRTSIEDLMLLVCHHREASEPQLLFEVAAMISRWPNACDFVLARFKATAKYKRCGVGRSLGFRMSVMRLLALTALSLDEMSGNQCTLLEEVPERDRLFDDSSFASLQIFKALQRGLAPSCHWKVQLEALSACSRLLVAYPPAQAQLLGATDVIFDFMHSTSFVVRFTAVSHGLPTLLALAHENASTHHTLARLDVLFYFLCDVLQNELLFVRRLGGHIGDNSDDEIDDEDDVDDDGQDDVDSDDNDGDDDGNQAEAMDTLMNDNRHLFDYKFRSGKRKGCRRRRRHTRHLTTTFASHAFALRALAEFFSATVHTGGFRGDDVLFLMCREAHDSASEASLCSAPTSSLGHVSAALDWLALRAGYLNGVDLVVHSLPALMERWYTNTGGIGEVEFPASLAGCTTPETFVQAHCAALITPIVMRCDCDLLDRVTLACEFDSVGTLLQEHFGVLVAAWMPFHQSDNAVANRVFEKLFIGCIGKHNYGGLFATHIEEIVARVVYGCMPGHEEVRKLVMAPRWTKAPQQHDKRGGCFVREPDYRVASTRENLKRALEKCNGLTEKATLLLKVQQCARDARRSNDRMRALQAYRDCVQRIQRPMSLFVMSDVLATAVRFMDDLWLYEAVLDLLEAGCDAFVACHDALLKPELIHQWSTLIALLRAYEPPSRVLAAIRIFQQSHSSGSGASDAHSELLCNALVTAYNRDVVNSDKDLHDRLLVAFYAVLQHGGTAWLLWRRLSGVDVDVDVRRRCAERAHRTLATKVTELVDTFDMSFDSHVVSVLNSDYLAKLESVWTDLSPKSKRPTQLRVAALNALHESLMNPSEGDAFKLSDDEEHEDTDDDDDDGEGGGEGSDAKKKRKNRASALVRLLLDVATSHADVRVRSAAGECLGHIGVRTVALGGDEVLDDKESLTAPIATVPKVYQVALDNSMKQRNLRLIEALDSYAFDRDIRLVEPTLVCLAAVQSHEHWQAVMKIKSPLVTLWRRRYQWMMKNNGGEVSPLELDGRRAFTSHDCLNPSLWTTTTAATGTSDGDETAVYAQWVCRLACSMIWGQCRVGDRVLLRLLGPLCRESAPFARTVLPWLVHELLMNAVDTDEKPLCAHEVRQKLTICVQALLSADGVHSEMVATAIDVILYLRTQRRPALGDNHNSVVGGSYGKKKRAAATGTSSSSFVDETGFYSMSGFDDNFWLGLEKSLGRVARSAHETCRRHHTALMLAELAWYERFEDAPTSSAVASDEEMLERREQLELFLSISQNLSDPDFFYGVNLGDDTRTLLNTYEHERKWRSSVGLYDMQWRVDRSQSSMDRGVANMTGLARSLHQLSHYGLLDMLLSQTSLAESSSSSAALHALQAETSWRQTMWEPLETVDGSLVHDETTLGGGGRHLLSNVVSFHESLRLGLASLRTHNYGVFRDVVDRARLSVVSELVACERQSSKATCVLLGRLQCLVELDEMWVYREQSLAAPGGGEGGGESGGGDMASLMALVGRWEARLRGLDAAGADDATLFDVFDVIYSLRTCMLHGLGKEGINVLQTQLLLFAQSARGAGRYHLASNCLGRLKATLGADYEKRYGACVWALKLEEAHLLWDQGERAFAKRSLKAYLQLYDLGKGCTEGDGGGGRRGGGERRGRTRGRADDDDGWIGGGGGGGGGGPRQLSLFQSSFDSELESSAFGVGIGGGGGGGGGGYLRRGQSTAGGTTGELAVPMTGSFGDFSVDGEDAVVPRRSGLTRRATDPFIAWAKGLRLCAEWSAELRDESPHVIMSQLERAARAVQEDAEEDGDEEGDDGGEGDGKRALASAAYLALARYTDRHFQQLIELDQSEQDTELRDRLQAEQREIEVMRKQKGMDATRSTELRSRSKDLANQIDGMNEQSKRVRADRERFLKEALKSYINVLRLSRRGTSVSGSGEGDSPMLAMLRLCSLWLEHGETHPGALSAVKERLGTLPTHHFLPLIHQLTARMGSATTCFQKTVQALVQRAAEDHPHHVLFNLMALADAEKEMEQRKPESRKLMSSSALSSSGVGARAGSVGQGTSQDSGSGGVGASCKSEASAVAAEMIAKVGAGPLAELVAQQQALADAYFWLAYRSKPSQEYPTTTPIPMKASDPIMSLRGLKLVPVPTSHIPVDPQCRYTSLDTVVSFKPTFWIPGGINAPKVVECIGSSGRVYQQLVKGKDDMRQDAVMQQVFGLVNTLLEQDAGTRRRGLHVRRYRVVPLTRRSGLLEWVTNTKTLGDYLVGKTVRGVCLQMGAHKRYRPRDWEATDCRKKMKDLQKSDDRAQIACYRDIMEHFRPVMRHFFFEMFPDPSEWYRRRLAYTRSVATSSAVGYIVGLGDRHVNNILIDMRTAELVHIDLGMAFEQGKRLLYPELVPFRLTRDLVDGMGVTGVEGVFRGCFERTLRRLREDQDPLLTVLDVLLHDPMYQWTLTADQAMIKQADDDDNEGVEEVEQKQKQKQKQKQSLKGSGESRASSGKAAKGEKREEEDRRNPQAMRVLQRLRQKLHGVENGVALSVEGQTAYLVEEARSVSNLAKIFNGWQAWL